MRWRTKRAARRRKRSPSSGSAWRRSRTGRWPRQRGAHPLLCRLSVLCQAKGPRSTSRAAPRGWAAPRTPRAPAAWAPRPQAGSARGRGARGLSPVCGSRTRPAPPGTQPHPRHVSASTSRASACAVPRRTRRSAEARRRAGTAAEHPSSSELSSSHSAASAALSTSDEATSTASASEAGAATRALRRMFPRTRAGKCRCAVPLGASVPRRMPSSASVSVTEVRLEGESRSNQ